MNTIWDEMESSRCGTLCRLVITFSFDVAGFEGVETIPIELVMNFRDFNDFWSPFLGGQGPVPTYVKDPEVNYETC